MEVRAGVFSGLGINCDDETGFAFEQAGAKVDYLHLQDLIEGRQSLLDYQILAFAGGFSYGDDTGAGNAYANRIRNNLNDKLMDFISRDKLVIGICNGFQILANLGLVPAFDGDYGERKVALVPNDFPRYKDVWVDLEINAGNDSPWLRGLSEVSFPIAHGEGKFYADEATLDKLSDGELIAAWYMHGGVCEFEGRKDNEYNPNGSLDDIAAITDQTERILGIMPHPERAIVSTQYPDWYRIRENMIDGGLNVRDGEMDGMKVFRNGVNFFK